MANLFEILRELVVNQKEKQNNNIDAQNYNKLVAGENIDENNNIQAKPVTPVQMSPSGGIDYAKSLELQQNTTPRTPMEHLTGRTMTMDRNVVDPKTNKTTLETYSNFKPGFLNDVVTGFNENYKTPFSFENFGHNKNFATRLGEGIGTTKRMLLSPMGRGLMTAAAIGALGGTLDNALAYGVNTMAKNQGYRTADKLYRDSLIDQMQNTIRNQEGFAKLKPEEQQVLLANAANRINSYRGYIGDDTYKQILTGMQLQDNAAYRNALLKTQMNNQILANQLAREKFNYDKGQDAIANQQKNRQLDIMENKIKLGTQKFRTAISDKRDALQQIKAMRELVNQNPNATGYVVGSFAKGGSASQKFANEFLSKNPGAIKTRAAISKLRGTTMHDLAGTAQTLQEQRNLAPFLPDATDNKKTILAKLDQLEAELTREMQTMLNAGMEYGYDFNNESFGKSSNNDPLGIR